MPGLRPHPGAPRPLLDLATSWLLPCLAHGLPVPIPWGLPAAVQAADILGHLTPASTGPAPGGLSSAPPGLAWVPHRTTISHVTHCVTTPSYSSSKQPSDDFHTTVEHPHGSLYIQGRVRQPGFRSRVSGFRSRLCCFLALKSWAVYLDSLCVI